MLVLLRSPDAHRLVRRLFWLLVIAPLALLRAQYIDLGFVPNPNNTVTAVAAQPDGKLIVGGHFTLIRNINRNYLVRFNLDGTIDSAFQPSIGAPVEALALQPDGKLVVGGRFSTVNGQTRNFLVRLNADGTTDTSFNALIDGHGVISLLLLPDGRIMVGGDFFSVHGVSRSTLVRLNANGMLDPSFTGDASGATTTGAAIGVWAIGRQSDGRILAGGQFTTANGLTRRGVARFAADGTLDATFDPMNGNSFASVYAITVQRDGRILLGGTFTLAGGLPRAYLARLNADGTTDASFNPNPSSTVNAIVEQADGRIVVGGFFSWLAFGGGPGIARVNADGSFDSTFDAAATGTISGTPGGVQTLLALIDGKLVVGGSFTSINNAPRLALARLVPPAPYISPAPATVNATLGAAQILAVPVSGAPATYQWRKNGLPIPGATNITLSFPAIQLTDAGAYDVVATNSFGSATSSPMSVTVNVAPQITQQPRNEIAVANSPVTFAVEASGTAPLIYQWRRNGVAISGATLASLTMSAAQASDGGNYTVIVSNLAGAVTSAPATLTVLPRAQLANLSVRTALGNNQSLIVGFVVNDGTAPILVRAAGPALAQFGLGSVMADPRIELYRDSTKLVENDNWPSVLLPTFTAVGGFSFAVNSLDAALMEQVTGSRSVVASGTGPGVVLVEAYDTAPPGGARLVNLSARNFVGTGDNILIAGFSIGGFGSMRVLIRAVGPTLAAVPFGLTGVLADPKLELFDDSGTKIAENDNWDATTGATFGTAGAFGLSPGSRDAALVATLVSARSYTVQVKGADGGTGTALVEIYELR